MIFLDLDGVLADFARASYVMHGRPYSPPTIWNYFEEWGISEQEFWSVIHSQGDSFYRDHVQPFPWMPELLELVQSIGPVTILTAPSHRPECYAGKRIWVDKFIGPNMDVIVCKQKHFLSAPGRTLIDDNPRNVLEWAQEGGSGMLFPSSSNYLAEYADRPMDFIAPGLESMRRAAV